MAILPPLHSFEVISNLTFGMGMGGSEGGMGTYLQCSGPYLHAILGAVSLLFNSYSEVFLSKDFCHQFNEHLDVKNSHALTELSMLPLHCPYYFLKQVSKSGPISTILSSRWLKR